MSRSTVCTSIGERKINSATFREVKVVDGRCCLVLQCGRFGSVLRARLMTTVA
jgi:hypothetical protein